MKTIAIIGGTGDLGMGLAVRLSNGYEVLIGSRDAAKASQAADSVRQISGGSVTGLTNDAAAARCDTAILAIPDLPTTETLQALGASLRGKLVISPIVPISFKDGVFSYAATGESAAEKVASVLGPRIVAAFHTVPANRLLKLNLELEYDVLVASDSKDDYADVSQMISGIRRLKPVYTGPLRTARMIEAMTPLLLNIAKYSGPKSPSFKVV